MKTSKCKSCGAEIVWVKTASGALMPVDAKPKSMVIVTEAYMTGQVVMAHTSHFATCPNANSHRKPAGDGR
jgi:hypothetical protein